MFLMVQINLKPLSKSHLSKSKFQITRFGQWSSLANVRSLAFSFPNVSCVETFKHNLLHFIPTQTTSRENNLEHLYKKKNDNAILKAHGWGIGDQQFIFKAPLIPPKNLAFISETENGRQSDYFDNEITERKYKQKGHKESCSGS